MTTLHKNPEDFQVKEIIDLMQSPSGEDKELVTRAFEFSQKAHEGQNRISGDSYIVHPFETAKILASIGLGPKSIAAGLLHDTLEDAGVKKEDLEKEFGKEIVFLVEGVTKLGKIKYHGAKRHSESLRKLFVAMSQDIRVIVIKLADRLNNMRTLNLLPEHKQRRIAEETLEIYAPIANRLGIGKLKRELEDLSFQYVYPKEHKEVRELMKQKNKDTEKRLEKVRRTLQKELAKEEVKIIKTDRRLKGLLSLFRKLQKYDMDINKIYDISALRVVVPEIQDCYKVLGVIHSIWRPLPGRIKDYIAFPKPNGYKSIHTTIFTGDGGIVEIQIRTEEMHKEAEFGVASHLSYKENGWGQKIHSGLMWILKLAPFKRRFDKENGENGKENGKQETSESDIPRWVKDLAEYQTISSQEKFEEEMKRDFFKERIFAFTPKGDVIDLPIESTPIDFAYAIHSDIGNHIYSAKINGKMVSLDTKLRNGDIVEIQTKESSYPTEKWLKDIKTAGAQKHIKAALEKRKIKN